MKLLNHSTCIALYLWLFVFLNMYSVGIMIKITWVGSREGLSHLSMSRCKCLLRERYNYLLSFSMVMLKDFIFKVMYQPIIVREMKEVSIVLYALSDITTLLVSMS